MIIAVDFDGVLCENRFPDIGKPNYGIINLVVQLVDAGHEVVLWTTRNGDELKNAIEWCKHYGLHFCAINAPAPSNKAMYDGVYETESRKIYADVYIDDHNLEYVLPRNGKKLDFMLQRDIEKGILSWQKEN